MFKDYDELITRVKDKPRKTVALINADDRHTLEAVVQAEEILDAVLVGDRELICKELKLLGKSPGSFRIVESGSDEHPCLTAARLIRKGEADFLMKGRIATGEMLKGVLHEESGLKKSGLMTHLSIQQVPSYHKLLFLTDSGMCLNPNLEEKTQILINALEFLHGLGYERPNVAALCAVETVNPRMPETEDARTLSQMAVAGELPACNLAGPISYDLAMVPESARIKGFDCEHVGEFDVLLAPNMLVGNILGKSLVYSAGGKMAGLILGARVPIVLTSRGARAEEKYNSLAIAAGVS